MDRARRAERHEADEIRQKQTRREEADEAVDSGG